MEAGAQILQLQLGQALIANQGYSGPATLKAFERAIALADEIGDVSVSVHVKSANLLDKSGLAGRYAQTLLDGTAPQQVSELFKEVMKRTGLK